MKKINNLYAKYYNCFKLVFVYPMLFLAFQSKMRGQTQDYATIWENGNYVGMNALKTTLVTSDNDSNTIVVGSFTSSITIGSNQFSSSGDNDLYVIKYNYLGTIIWSKKIGGSGIESANALTTDKDGNIYLVGEFSSPNIEFGDNIALTLTGVSDFFIVKLNGDNGTTLWAKNSGTTKYASISVVKTDLSGNIYIGGTFKEASITLGSQVLQSSSTSSISFISKINPLGIFTWANSNNQATGDTFISGLDINGNSLVISGYYNSKKLSYNGIELQNTLPPNTTTSSSYFNDGYISKFDMNSGSAVWITSVSGGKMEKTTGICSDSNGNIYVSGNGQSDIISIKSNTNSINLNSNLNGKNLTFITAINSNGNPIWIRELNTYDRSEMGAENSIDYLATIVGFDGTFYYYVMSNFMTSKSLVYRTNFINSESNIADSPDRIDSFQVDKFGFVYTTNTLFTRKGKTICGTVSNLPSGYVWYDVASGGQPMDASTPIPNGSSNTYTFYGDKIINGSPVNSTRLVFKFPAFTHTYFEDSDGDFYGNPNVYITACSQPNGYASNSSDCDDTDAGKHELILQYIDADGDGYGVGSGITTCGLLQGYAKLFGDCDDTNSAIHGVEAYPDSDDDGYSPGLTVLCIPDTDPLPSGYKNKNTNLDYDCDDNNPAIHGVQAYLDSDGDGYSPGSTLLCIADTAPLPSGYRNTSLGNDCNDAAVTIHPGAKEIYFDNIDQDCDNYIDESEITTTIIANANTLIYCQKAIGTQGYTFKVYTQSSTLVQTYFSTTNYFNLAQLASAVYSRNERYIISVALKKDGVLQPYGPPTNVYSPKASSRIISTQCDALVTNLGNFIVNLVAFTDAAGYRVTISNGEEKLVLNTVTPNFNFSSLPDYFKTETTRFDVTVSVKGSNGIYSDEGNSCSLRVPKPIRNTTVSTTSLASIIKSQCGFSILYLNSAIYSTVKTGVTSYTFEVTKVNGTGSGVPVVFSTSNRYFILKNLIDTAPLGFRDYNSTYAIRVAWDSGVFGPTCYVSTPPSTTAKETEEIETLSSNDLFEVVGYPNPFKSTFSIEFTSDSIQDVNIAVIDMLGRVIEERTVTIGQVSSQIWGDNYPSGMYVVKISQGNLTENIKMVKK